MTPAPRVLSAWPRCGPVVHRCRATMSLKRVDPSAISRTTSSDHRSPTSSRAAAIGHGRPGRSASGDGGHGVSVPGVSLKIKLIFDAGPPSLRCATNSRMTERPLSTNSTTTSPCRGSPDSRCPRTGHGCDHRAELNAQDRIRHRAMGGRPAGGCPARRLTRGAKGESGPAFTSDGDLLFTARPTDDDDKPPAALWRLPAAGGEAERIAELPGGVRRCEPRGMPRWSRSPHRSCRRPRRRRRPAVAKSAQGQQDHRDPAHGLSGAALGSRPRARRAHLFASGRTARSPT